MNADARYTVASASVLALVRFADARGLGTGDLLARAGVSGADLVDVDGRIGQAAYNKLFEALTDRSGDADFGLHFAESSSPDAFHVVGQLAIRAATLGEALDRVARYSRIVHDAGRVEVERSGDTLVVHPGCRGLAHDVPRQVAEYSAASLVVVARRITRAAIAPARVGFRHARPASIGEHRRVFGITPMFGEQETTVVFEAATADIPIAGADPTLSSLLEHLARGLLERLGEDDDLVARVQTEIAKHLERGAPDLDALARRLGMSGRTLQRRLAAFETTFQEVVDSVRRRCAERYIRDARLSLHEIAFLLGFSDPSNFHRAFRRWFGVTPAQLRRGERS